MKKLIYLIFLTLLFSCKKDESGTGTNPKTQQSFTVNERDINYAMVNDNDPYIEVSFDASALNSLPPTHYIERFYRIYTVDGYFRERTITRYESQNGSPFVKENSWTSVSPVTLFSWSSKVWPGTTVNLIPETSIIE